VPKTWEHIDAVFVAFEPRGGSLPLPRFPATCWVPSFSMEGPRFWQRLTLSTRSGDRSENGFDIVVFDTHRPYQLSSTQVRTCQFRAWAGVGIRSVERSAHGVENSARPQASHTHIPRYP